MTHALLAELALLFRVESESYRDPTHTDNLGGLRVSPRPVDDAEATRLAEIACELGARAWAE